MKQLTIIAVLAGAALLFPVRALAVDVDAYIKNDSFTSIQLSPDGKYMAATVPLGDRTALAIMRRSDNQVTANIALGANRHVEEVTWVSDDRVVVAFSEKFGALDKPQWTGELFGINADGSRKQLLVGQRARDDTTGSRIQPRGDDLVFATLVDELPDDPKHVIIAVSPFSAEPFTRAAKMDVFSGRRVQVAIAPVQRADFVTDSQGVVRFALGAGSDNARKLYYRKGDGAEWELLNNEGVTGLAQSAIGFAEGDQVAYLQAERADGPDAILAFDTVSRETREVLRDDNVDPARVLYRHGTRVPIGVLYADGKPRTAFFDDTSEDARLYRSLEAAFGGDPVMITSRTRDGRVALVNTWSDRSPGDFYLFDTVAKKADHVLSQREWLDPEQMATMRPVQFKSRDGLALHGYLTVPQAADGKPAPLVVMPHGGPFGVRDTWRFNDEVQMLADAGYAVLQVNFRGSGGYGKSFKSAGAQQWGLAMQRDLTDATRWAIQQGVAASDRICIYGASYGAYAALMGVATEPELYKCAAGYVGVYDLPMMHAEDSGTSASLETWVNEWVGEKNVLGAVSPNRLADRIKAPVFLAAGGEDKVAPIKHTEMMEAALRQQGAQVETLYYPNEGHGFYVEANRREYYTRLLAFLARSLGGETAGGGAAAAAGK
ncbi:MAG: S9 family peptidase [Gemmatimonadota bacterium]|nr:S9 family peptidase [Gemmatimonadota bacterium]